MEIGKINNKQTNKLEKSENKIYWILKWIMWRRMMQIFEENKNMMNHCCRYECGKFFF